MDVCNQKVIIESLTSFRCLTQVISQTGYRYIFIPNFLTVLQLTLSAHEDTLTKGWDHFPTETQLIKN